MADLSPQRLNIQAEEVVYKNSVSESLLTRVGKSVNFINYRQYDSKHWFLNGPYGSVAGSQTGVDGAYICFSDMEITGIAMYNLIAGSAGTLELNIKKHASSGASGTTIFSTTPKLVFSSGNNSFLFYDFLNSTAVEAPAGCTQPVLTSINLDKGDMLTCDISQKQTAGETAGLIIMMRPR